ncbi:hydroxyacylglutathione hydrolase [Acrasis kona]|uniref:Hydroxyacylglutathione hydrolase n=1 Tax=Acrasis kona TaxID=1008807 RepID=A0AAW2ZF76_9EUKA
MNRTIIALLIAIIATVTIADQKIGVPVLIGPNFWNIRGNFRVMAVVNIHTQMSVIKLPNGKFLIVDTIDLTSDLKSALDRMTNNGANIEAIIGVHPFHTTYFKAFYDAYPTVPFYGTPRHLRVVKDIPWKGDLNQQNIRNKWNPDVEIRLPAGAEFVNPQPEDNHFNSAWLFHKPSRTMHIDDTVIYADEDSLVLKIFGIKKGDMIFHPKIDPGLYNYPAAPFEFRDWVLKVIKDWDFDNIVCAHLGNKLGGAKLKLNQTVTAAEPLFRKLSEKRK